MFDERALRKPGFDEAGTVAVTMPCGVAFHLPKPILFIEPIFRDGRRTEEARLCTDDPEFDRLKDAVTAAAKEDGDDFTNAVTDLAIFLLRKSYDLADAHLGKIFRVPADGEGYSTAWMSTVMAVAHGRGQHSFVDGSVSS